MRPAKNQVNSQSFRLVTVPTYCPTDYNAYCIMCNENSEKLKIRSDAAISSLVLIAKSGRFNSTIKARVRLCWHSCATYASGLVKWQYVR